MARRRRIQGRPLLVATAAAAMVIGCSGGTKKEAPPPGNLMPPPTMDIEVCVDTVPEGAKVSLQASTNTEFSERCETIEVYQGSTGQLVVEAAGYQTNQQSVVLDGPKIELRVELVQNEVPELDRPVGNLMPPPELEPPVGNLMPPQEIIGEPAPAPEKPEQ